MTEIVKHLFKHEEGNKIQEGKHEKNAPESHIGFCRNKRSEANHDRHSKSQHKITGIINRCPPFCPSFAIINHSFFKTWQKMTLSNFEKSKA